MSWPAPHRSVGRDGGRREGGGDDDIGLLSLPILRLRLEWRRKGESGEFIVGNFMLRLNVFSF